MTNIERFEIFTKPYLRNKDIAKVLECSTATATKVMKEIKQHIVKQGFKPFDGCVSTKAFLEFTGIDIKEIHELAIMERDLKQ